MPPSVPADRCIAFDTEAATATPSGGDCRFNL